MVICFAAVICITINAREDNLELVDATIGDLEMTEEEREEASIEHEEVEVQIGARMLGICLIVLAAAFSAGTAVFNRALK